MTTWKDELNSVLEQITGAPIGSTPFWVTSGIALGTLLLLGWLIANFIFSAKRGIVLTFVAQILPGIAALAGWIAVTLYALPELNAGLIRDYLPLGGAVLAGFLATLLMTRFFLGISEGKTLLSVTFTYICVVASIFLGGSLVREMDSSLENLGNQTEERKKEADSILSY